MSLQATLLQDLRTNYPSNLDRDELRITRKGLLQAVMEMTTSPKSIVSADLIALARQSVGRQLDVPTMQRGAVTLKSARTCTVVCAQSESGFVTVTFRTLVADMCIVPSQFRNNEIGMLDDMNRKITDIVDKFLETIEEDLDTALDANKSQVYNSSIVGAGADFEIVADAIQVPVVDQDFFFNNIDAINFADDFDDENVKIIGSHALMRTVDLFFNQGSTNSENKNFQFSGKDFRFSNRITNTKRSTGYWMPDGTVGLVTRVDIDAQDGNTASDGTSWSEDRLNGMPFNVGVKFDSTCADNSALEASGTDHLDATLEQHWQFSFDFGIIVPFNSAIATKASSIRKFEFIA